MSKPLSNSARKVQKALDELGMHLQVIELPDSTRTAMEAAQAVGCEVGQIVKSLVFRTLESGRPILVIASGPNRVDEKKVAERVGEPLGKANADFVRDQTGFVIGGVPPMGHTQTIETYIDADLLAYPQVWAAAGTPHAVFSLSPQELVRMTGGEVMQLKLVPSQG